MLEKCPVCLGNGLVPNGFYSTTRQEYGCLVWTTGGVDPEICRTCDGKGFVAIEPKVKEPEIEEARKAGAQEVVEWIEKMKWDKEGG